MNGNENKEGKLDSLDWVAFRVLHYKYFMSWELFLY
jgi:hypothetical protein